VNIRNIISSIIGATESDKKSNIGFVSGREPVGIPALSCNSEIKIITNKRAEKVTAIVDKVLSKIVFNPSFKEIRGILCNF